MHLIEAVFAIAVQALLSAALVQQIAFVAIVTSRAERTAQSREDSDQIERLIHVARNAASMSADVVAPVAAISGESLTLHADLDNNGRIDTRSSETITLYIGRDRNKARLMHRIGRQSMALSEGANRGFSLTVRNNTGAETQDAAKASLLALAWSTSAGDDDSISWFALPRPLP